MRMQALLPAHAAAFVAIRRAVAGLLSLLVVLAALPAFAEVLYVRPAGNHYTTDPPFTVAAGTDVGDDIIFTTLTPTICSVGPTFFNQAGTGQGTQSTIYYDAATVTLTGTPGLCSIAVNGAGHFGFTPAPQQTSDSLIVLANPSRITSPNQATFTQGSPGSFTFTTGPVISPTYELDFVTNLPAGLTFNAATATISGTPTNGGSVGFTFKLFEAGLLVATQSFTLNVTFLKTPQTITTPGTSLGTHATTDPPFDIRAASDSFLSLTFTSLTPSICTVGPVQFTTFSIYYNFVTVTLTGAVGTCRIAVDQPGDAQYLPAATQIFSGTVGTGQVLSVVTSGPGSVSTADGTINCGTACTALFPTSSTVGLIAAPSGPGALLIAWAGACSGNGPCNVTMTAAKGVSAIFGVPPVITSVNHATFPVAAAATFTMTATGTPAANWSVSGALPSGVILDGGGALHGTPALGTVGIYPVTIRASNGALPDAVQSFTLTVSKSDQGIFFVNPGPQTLGLVISVPLTYSATSGLAPVLTSLTPSVCSVSPSTLINPVQAAVMVSPGLCTIAADQPGDANYNAAPQVVRSFTLSSSLGTAPTITSAAQATFTVQAAGTFTVIASGNPAPTLSVSGALPSGVTFTPATGALAGTPALGTVGVYPLSITAANGTLPNGTQSFTLTVAKASQTITFAGPAAQTLSATPIALSATSTSGLAVTFTSATLPVCTVSGSSVTMLATGTCTINANQAGDVNYNAALQVQRSFAISPSGTAPTITSVNHATFTIGSAGTFTVTATGSPVPTLSEAGSLPAGVTFTPATGALAGTPALGTAGLYSLTFNATSTTLPSASQAFALTVAKESQTINFANPGPQVMSATPVTLTASASSGLAVSFSSLTTTVCTVAGNQLTAKAAGTCTIAADQAGDTSFTAAVQVLQSFAVSEPTRLGNISTRMPVLSGGNVMIAGFIIGGLTSKTVAITATGPSLAPFGITNYLPDPTITLVRSADGVTLATNDDWQTDVNHALLQSSGFAPADPKEAGLYVTLPPGAYTAIVAGAGGTTGVSVVGVFEVDHPEIPLVNISTRGFVQTGGNVMIGGFIINGSSPQKIAVTATGPSLAPFGITNFLPDPTLQIVRSADGVTIATNDDWQTDVNHAQLQASGFAPGSPLEPGLFLTLPPGAYTAIVSGKNNATGVAVVGAFTVP